MYSLSDQHPRFSSLTREQLYDRVTGMFLDCWDDGEIAHVLSREFNREVEPHDVADIRAEAGAAAETQTPDVRRRWIYRYRRLTVNNLVKEYMFMEGKRDFMKAKRELAEEIDALVKSTSSDRLCIAVNDALGRNNIPIEMIRELQAYAERARKLDVLVRPYAKARGMDVDKAMADIAGQTGSSDELTRGNVDRPLMRLRDLLQSQHVLLEAEDLEFFAEYRRFGQASDGRSTMMKIMRGADVMPRPPSPVEQAIAGAAHHISITGLHQLIDSIRSSPVMGAGDLEQIREYAERHVKDLSTLRELGRDKDKPKALQDEEMHLLDNLQYIVGRHLQLMDCDRFFSPNEIRRAERDGIGAVDLQAIMERINAQGSEEQVRLLVDKLLSGRRYKFPTERYLEFRFRLDPK